jgi:hypothetical protein
VFASIAAAGPVEFGLAELNSAIAAKNLKIKVRTEISLDMPEAFRIELFQVSARISGGDLRGLMYGLIEAADQIKATGKLKSTRGTPAARLRGVRLALGATDLEQPWATSETFWREYIQMLARARINRLNLVIPRLQGQSLWLRKLPQIATDHGIDFTFSPMLLTGTAEEVRESFASVLSSSSLIRGVEMNADLAAPLDLLRDGMFRAIRDAGRRVTLDLHGAAERPELARTALDLGVPLRISGDAGCGSRGSDNFCAPGAGYEYYWEVRDPSPDPDAVLKRTPELSAEGAIGFEMDAPRSHLGGSEGDWAFAPYTKLYSLWGRLSFDPKYEFPAPAAQPRPVRKQP